MDNQNKEQVINKQTFGKKKKQIHLQAWLLKVVFGKLALPTLQKYEGGKY